MRHSGRGSPMNEAPTTPLPATIAPARTADDVAAVVALFRAYAASLEVDLAYQGFEAELAALPGRYAPPRGALLLARRGGMPVGCVALRPLGDGVGNGEIEGLCEMKRLYVSPEGRGAGLGRRLIEAVLAEARRLGHREVRLDTLPSMDGAIALYRALGFEPIPPYYDTPVPGTLFLRRRLGAEVP